MADLKGYGYKSVSNAILRKNNYVLNEELVHLLDREGLNMRIHKSVSEGGKAYFVMKKKEVCGIIVIDYKKYYASDFVADENNEIKKSIGDKMMESAVRIEDNSAAIFGQKNKAKEDEKKKLAFAYELSELYLTDDLKSKEKIVMYDIMDILKEAAAFNDSGVKVIIWGETIVADKTLGKVGSNAMSIGVSLGMCLGAAFGGLVYLNHGDTSKFALCISFGMLIGLSIGTAYYNYSVKMDKASDENEKE